MKLNLKHFDITSVKDDNIVVFIGRRNSGKSFAIKDLLYYHRDLPIGTVISPTETSNPFYGDIVPKLFIHDEYTAELLDNVVRRQKMMKKKIRKEMHCYGKNTIDPRAFLILDDCLYDNVWAKDKNMKFLFMNGRHVNEMVIITMQYPLGIPPNLRSNVDYTFIFRDNFIGNRKRIYENYAGMFPNLDCFNQIMDQCTENFECLVINNTTKSNKLEDQVFWYKADNHPSYTIGCRELWQCHNDNFNDDDNDDDEELFDIDSFKKKNQHRINVKKKY